jgi:transcriptional regulator with XRE-family HTH domain
MTEFSRRLRVIMVGLDNMPQKDFAKELGISPAHLSNILLGKTSPSIPITLKCAKIAKLGTKETLDLLISALSSSTRIEADIEKLSDERKEILGKVLGALLLPIPPKDAMTTEEKRDIEYSELTIHNKVLEIYETAIRYEKFLKKSLDMLTNDTVL